MVREEYIMYGIVVSHDDFLKADSSNGGKPYHDISKTDEIQCIYLIDDDENVFIGGLVSQLKDNVSYSKLPVIDDMRIIKIKTAINQIYNVHGDTDYFIINKLYNNQKTCMG